MPSPSLTLRAAYNRWYLDEAVDLSPSTRARYHFELLRWESLTDNPDVRQITKQTANAFRRAGIEARYAKSSIESTLAVVHRILRVTAETEGSPLDSVPVLGKRLKQPHPSPRALSVDQLDALYRQAHVCTWPRVRHRSTGQRLPTAVWWRCFDVILFFTGLRLADLMTGLHWTNVGEHTLCVTARKTGKRHMFPLHPVLLAHLEALRGFDRDQILPVKSCRNQIRRELRRRCIAACIEPAITPKHLRQNAGTHWEQAEGGAGPKLLGHTLGVSDRYISLPAVLKAAVQKLTLPPAFREGPFPPDPQDVGIDPDGPEQYLLPFRRPA